MVSLSILSLQTLYLARGHAPSGQHGEGGGIYLSENGGKSWQPVLERDQHVYDVTIDPDDTKFCTPPALNPLCGDPPTEESIGNEFQASISNGATA